VRDRDIEEVLQRPPLQRDGLPPNGAAWGTQTVIRGVSHGPDLEVQVRNLGRKRPLRVVGFAGEVIYNQFKSTGNILFVHPRGVPVGREFAILVE